MNWTQFWISNTENMWNRSLNCAKKKLFHKWKTWWAARKFLWEKIKTSKSTHKMLKLYKKLFKTWSFIVIQLWSDKTKLAAFLHKKNIRFSFFNCFCEQNKETLKHIMIYCIKHLKMYKKLEINEQVNLKKIMFSFKKIKKITTW